MNFKLHKNDSGFTLIELMATLAILALIVVIAVPSIGTLIANADEKAEATSIAMIENAGGIADAAGLVHDDSSTSRYYVATLIREGYLDMSEDDPLAVNASYVQKESHTYEYSAAPEPTDANLLNLVIDGDSVTVAGFNSDIVERPRDLVIGSEYNGVPVTHISNYAFSKVGLESVIIQDGIESMGQYAFQGNGLTSAYIPDSIEAIAGSAFGQNQLSSVRLSDSVTSIGAYAFYDNKIESVSFGEALTDIGRYSFTFNHLKTVTIPDGVTSIEGSVFGHNQLTSVVLHDGIDTIKSYAFAYNILESIAIPDSVNTIGDTAFVENPRLAIYGGAMSAASRYPLEDSQRFIVR